LQAVEGADHDFEVGDAAFGVELDKVDALQIFLPTRALIRGRR
jgi:hypothetical protein